MCNLNDQDFLILLNIRSMPEIVKDSTYFDNNPENPYWINIDFPFFNGRIFISYKTIGGKSVYKVKTP